MLALAGALLVALCAAAFACANLATLNLSTPAATPGAEVTATSSLVSTPLVLHWDGPHGLVLAEARPDRDGRISAAFTVPDGKVGPHRVVATRVGPAGVDSHVTEAVSPLDVRAPRASATRPGGGLLVDAGGGAGLPFGALAAGVLGAGLLVAGATRAWGHPVSSPAAAPGRAPRP